MIIIKKIMINVNFIKKKKKKKKKKNLNFYLNLIECNLKKKRIKI